MSRRVLSLGFPVFIPNKQVSLWRFEILVFALFFVSIFITFDSLRRMDSEVTGKIADSYNRISFVETYSKLASMAGLFPRRLNTADASHAISAIRELAEQNKAVIERFSLGSEEVSKQEDVSILPAQYHVVIQEKMLMSFLSGLRNLDFLCRIESLKIDPKENPEETLDLHFRLCVINILRPIQKDSLRSKASRFKSSPYDRQETPPFSDRKIFKGAVKLSEPAPGASFSSQPASNISDFKLVAIIDDGMQRAVLEDKKSTVSYFLAEGDSINNMRVTKIGEGEVILEGAQERHTLVL